MMTVSISSLLPTPTISSSSSTGGRRGSFQLLQSTLDLEDPELINEESDLLSASTMYSHSSNIRRAMLAAAVGSISAGASSTSASAAGFNPLRQKSSLYVVDTRTEMTDSVSKTQVDTPVPTLSSEYALLRVLPVKNPIFRILETNLETLSALRFAGEL